MTVNRAGPGSRPARKRPGTGLVAIATRGLSLGRRRGRPIVWRLLSSSCRRRCQVSGR